MTSSLADHPDRARPAGNEGHQQQSQQPKPRREEPAPRINTSRRGDSGSENTNQQFYLGEQSPLLSPVDNQDGSASDPGADEADEFQTTKSVWYMILLTTSIGGLQIAWSVEMSDGSPYLLSLGISKSLMALVWIAGPLSGTLVQPYVGMMSDNCRIRWGKRKPFMLGGAAATIVSLMFLAWTREIVTGFLGLFGADPQSEGVKFCIICTAVLWIYILDFAINTGMAPVVRIQSPYAMLTCRF